MPATVVGQPPPATVAARRTTQRSVSPAARAGGESRSASASKPAQPLRAAASTGQQAQQHQPQRAASASNKGPAATPSSKSPLPPPPPLERRSVSREQSPAARPQQPQSQKQPQQQNPQTLSVPVHLSKPLSPPPPSLAASQSQQSSATHDVPAAAPTVTDQPNSKAQPTLLGKVIATVVGDPLWVVNAALVLVALRLHWLYALAANTKAAAAAAEAAARAVAEAELLKARARQNGSASRDGGFGSDGRSDGFLGAPMVMLPVLLGVLVLAAYLRHALPEWTGKKSRLRARSTAETGDDDGAAGASDRTPPASARRVRSPGQSPGGPAWDTVSEESAPSSRSAMSNQHAARGALHRRVEYVQYTSATQPRTVDGSYMSTASLLTAADGGSTVNRAARGSAVRDVSTINGGSPHDAAVGTDDAVYALLAAWKSRRHESLDASRLTADEFERLRDDVHRQLFAGTPAACGVAESAPTSLAPTPNASTVAYDGIAPSQQQHHHHLPPQPQRGRSLSSSPPTPRSPPAYVYDDSAHVDAAAALGPHAQHLMAELRAAAESVHLDAEMDIEALFAGYCRPASE